MKIKRDWMNSVVFGVFISCPSPELYSLDKSSARANLQILIKEMIVLTVCT